MTSKKRRQRGSRTHGGGSHKNRRGAGNRGGRGRAGRDKHEFHSYEQREKKGFNRDNFQEDFAEVDVRTLDEEVKFFKMRDVKATSPFDLSIQEKDLKTDGGITTAPTSCIENIQFSPESSAPRLWQPEESDAVYADIRTFDNDAKGGTKLLNTGSVTNKVRVITDSCSKAAKYEIRSKGGNVIFTAKRRDEQSIVEEQISKKYLNHISEWDNAEDGRQLTEDLDELEFPLEFYQVDDLMRQVDSQEQANTAYDIMSKQSEAIDNPSELDAIGFMMARSMSNEYGFDNSIFTRVIDQYFDEFSLPKGITEHHRSRFSSPPSVERVLNIIDQIYDDYETGSFEDQEELRQNKIQKQVKTFLYSMDSYADWF